jgi:hypothetical protein
MGTLFSDDTPNESFHFEPVDDDENEESASKRKAKRSTSDRTSYVVYKEKIDERYNKFTSKHGQILSHIILCLLQLTLVLKSSRFQN